MPSANAATSSVKKCNCDAPGNCVIRIRSLYRGGFEFNIGVNTTGHECINQALQSMGIPNECACFFGLQHEAFGDRYWIDPDRSVFDQLNASHPCCHAGDKRVFTILLRIRFFGIDDIFLDNDIFRNFLFHQLKKDFIEGKLTRKAIEIVSLAAYLMHYGSLTILSHAFSRVEFEKKLSTVLPKTILSGKVLAPYVQMALKIISNLTLEQTRMRFIHQCQLLPHYGIEKFSANAFPAQATYFICFSCCGIIFERSRASSSDVIEWESVSRILTKHNILQVEFRPGSNRPAIVLTFSNPDDSLRACECGIAQQDMALIKKWKRLTTRFHPLVHVPHSILQFDGESDKLSAAINDLFARSSDDLCPTGGRRDIGYFPFTSEANIASRLDTCDEFSLRSAEESTLPLIYGSILAQSTPVLRHQSTDRLANSRAGCASAINLPHKKRLAASRPLISAGFSVDQSIGALFSSNQTINNWTLPKARQSLSLACVNTEAMAFYQHVSLSREVSDEVALKLGSRCLSSTGISVKENDGPSPAVSTEPPHLALSDRSTSMVIPTSTANDVPEVTFQRRKVTKFNSECSLAKRPQLRSNADARDKQSTARKNAVLAESADDLTNLPSGGKNYPLTKTLPASFKRSAFKTNKSGRLLCFELIQKLHNRPELETEYKALPSMATPSPDDHVITVDLGLPVRFLVAPSLSKSSFEHEAFWNEASNIIVLLDAQFLLEKDDPTKDATNSVLSLFRSDVVSGDHVAIGQIFLSLFSVSRSASCHTFGVHIKRKDFFPSYGHANESATRGSSQHLLPAKTVWLFCLIDVISSSSVPAYGNFVDEIVAVELSTCHPPNEENAFTTITVSATSGSLAVCSLYIVSHVLLRTFRVVPNQGDSVTVRSIFESVAKIRRSLPSTVVTLDEYIFLHELLLRWLEKPPRLI